jgi:hypothetical protein
MSDLGSKTVVTPWLILILMLASAKAGMVKTEVVMKKQHQMTKHDVKKPEVTKPEAKKDFKKDVKHDVDAKKDAGNKKDDVKK